MEPSSIEVHGDRHVSLDSGSEEARIIVGMMEQSSSLAPGALSDCMASSSRKSVVGLSTVRGLRVQRRLPSAAVLVSLTLCSLSMPMSALFICSHTTLASH